VPEHGSIPPVLPTKKGTRFHPFFKVYRAVWHVNICAQSKMQNHFFSLWLQGWFCSSGLSSQLPSQWTGGSRLGESADPSTPRPTGDTCGPGPTAPSPGKGRRAGPQLLRGAIYHARCPHVSERCSKMPLGSLMGLISHQEGRRSPASTETLTCRHPALVFPLPHFSRECLKA